MIRRLLNPSLLKAAGATLKGDFQSIRKSHVVSYRTASMAHSKATSVGAEVVSALMWWWILWHLWHEPDHITGEFPYPETKKWSNKELGIPADDA